jgi:exosortase/archaeosortase family protein
MGTAGDAPDAAAPLAQGRDPWLRFALTFAALAVISELVYYGVALESQAFHTYLATVARICGFILGFFTDEVSVRDTYISSSLFSVEIARGCDAYRICALLSAAILAFPARWRTKLWGLFLGLLWLNLLNFFRITSLFFIGGYFHTHFRTSHEVYFPIFLICMTVAAWIVWVRQATREAFDDEPTPA